jgi:mutator protein MutT
MPDYIHWIREKVGHERIFLNVAGVVVFDGMGRVLLQKRSANEKLWGFPGGIIELGESAEEAAIREVREETGLDVKIDSLIGIYTKYYNEYPNGDKAQPILVIFKGRVVRGEFNVDGKETFDLAFFELDEVPVLFNSQHNDILDDIRNNRIGVYR